jgi:chemotaxis family two-component system sensor kinase Cph1
MTASTSVDLSACDREPIHIPGTIQAHGALLALRGPDFTVVQASANTAEWFGLEPAQVLGRPLSAVLPAEAWGLAEAALSRGDLRTANPVRLTLGEGTRARPVNALLHRQEDVILLEVEARDADGGTGALDLFAQVRMSMTRFLSASTLEALCGAAAEEVRRVTGFDRVMVYRFDADWHGEVIGESVREGVDSFLGLHFPASDIPAQARRLYAQNWLRQIPDVRAPAVPLLAARGLAPDKPLDLSFATLRSVSPVHLEYLRNMEVNASMSISIMQGERLWGLIACHHLATRRLSYEERAACEFIGQLLSGEVSARTQRAQAEAQARQGAIQAQLVQRMSREERFLEGLISGTPSLLEVVSASGATVWLEQGKVSMGRTPTEAQTQELVNWLGQVAGDRLFQTDSLPRIYPPAAAFAEVASGLLAVPLSTPATQWVLWFRPEVLQSVTWAGNPHKPVEEGVRLSPRKSFSAWQETVHHTALRWKAEEVAAAQEFRGVMVGVVLRKAAELARVNAELARSNEELDAFTYIASHDLKEPLRGIQLYTRFIIEDAAERLDPETRERLSFIHKLGVRMQELLEGLFHYSRVGRIQLSEKETDLQALVEDVLTTLRGRLEETRTEVRIPRRLPTVRCDVLRVREVLANLISNAAKYNDKAERWVEIGFSDSVLPPGQAEAGFALYVRDNGIGIPAKHHKAVFEMFRRLHSQEAYGGGTGVGLAIVQRVVERHGGQVWLESTPGEGTTFFFTLGPSAGGASWT